MSVIKFDKDVVSKKEILNFNRKGISYIKKIKSKGDKFLEGDFIKGFDLIIDEGKLGAVFEVCFIETKTIEDRDGNKKDVKIKKFYYADNNDKKINEISYAKVIDIFTSEESSLYN